MPHTQFLLFILVFPNSWGETFLNFIKPQTTLVSLAFYLLYFYAFLCLIYAKKKNMEKHSIHKWRQQHRINVLDFKMELNYKVFCFNLLLKFPCVYWRQHYNRPHSAMCAMLYGYLCMENKCLIEVIVKYCNFICIHDF